MEPLSGLIEFMTWDEEGNGTARFRYYSMAQHTFGNGQLAGRFVDGVYTCALPDGRKALEASGADGVRVTLCDEDEAPMHSFHASGLADARGEIEATSGRFFGRHPNDRLAVAATFSQAMYDAWGVEVRVSPQAALSPAAYSAFRGGVAPWLELAARSQHDDVRMHAERGLAALRSDQIDMTTVLAWMVLAPPTLDYDASVLCHLVMSADPATRARADVLLQSLGPDNARAAFRLALMRNEDHNSAVQVWVEDALLRLGKHGLAKLNGARSEPWLSMLRPTIEWLEAQLGQG